MDKRNAGNNIKPIIEKKNAVEEVLEKDNSTEALAKAIKSLLNKDKAN